MNPYEEDELMLQRQQKQAFLKQEIIEKGYDGAQFAEYLNGVKPEGGGNIDIWAFSELKDLVERFKTISSIPDPVTDENFLTESAPPQIDYTSEDPPNITQNITYTEQDSVVYNEQPSMISDTKSYTSRATNKSRTIPDVSTTSAAIYGGAAATEENKYEDNSHPTDEANPKRSRGMSQDNKTDQPHHEGRERDESYCGTMNVKLGEITQLSDAKNTEVVIQGYEQVKSGLFSTTHIQYLIKTLPFGWEVKRRFSDFFWLRTTLLKLHPGVLVPPIPKKTNKFKPDFLKKRMYFLQRFLNACILNDELRADKYFLSFLSTTNETQYKNHKKEAEKKPRFTRIKEIVTVTGQVPLEINKGIKHHAASFGELCASTDPIYTKIKRLSKQLIADFEQVSNTLFSLAECYAGLYSLASNFNKHTEVGKNLHLEDIYMTINNLTVAWAEQTLTQTDNIQKNFSYFYKYAKYENDSFKEVLENRMKSGLDYLAKKKELMTRKDKLFQTRDISKWEIPSQKLKEISKDALTKDKKLAYDLMLPKETAALNEVRNTFAYYNAMCFNDLDRGLREKCKQYAKNFSEFGKTQSSIMQQIETKWNDLLGHFGESTTSLGSRGGEIKTRATVLPRHKPDEVMGGYEDD